MTSKIIYLASPYTHQSIEVRNERFRAANRAAAKLIKQGHIVYSPITMTHPIDMLLAEEDGTLGSKFWVDFDEAFMGFCSEIYVLKIAGWDTSSGVKREIEFFNNSGKPVTYLDPEDQ